MNESIKTFSLVVITICVFIMTVIDVLNLVNQRSEMSGYTNVPTTNIHAPATLPDPNTPKTSFKFNEMNFDFGDLTQGDVVHHTFTFTNTGNNPLIITDAKGSCGCTIPTYPHEPIAPGATGNIEVQFNSTGKKDIQDKTVTLTANTEPMTTILSIHANVHEKQ